MADTLPTEVGPMTDDEFEARLVELLRAARVNGVDIEGDWADRNPDSDAPDWGIEIYRVAKPASN